MHKKLGEASKSKPALLSQRRRRLAGASRWRAVDGGLFTDDRTTSGLNTTTCGESRQRSWSKRDWPLPMAMRVVTFNISLDRGKNTKSPVVVGNQHRCAATETAIESPAAIRPMPIYLTSFFSEIIRARELPNREPSVKDATSRKPIFH